MGKRFVATRVLKKGLKKGINKTVLYVREGEILNNVVIL